MIREKYIKDNRTPYVKKLSYDNFCLMKKHDTEPLPLLLGMYCDDLTGEFYKIVQTKVKYYLSQRKKPAR